LLSTIGVNAHSVYFEFSNFAFNVFDSSDMISS